MAWDGFAPQTGKYRSIRPMKCPKCQTRIFGRMESAHVFHVETGGKILLNEEVLVNEWQTKIRHVKVGLQN